MKVAAIADVHFGQAGPVRERRSPIGSVLLKRAVRRLTRYVRPDVTLVLGDLLEDGGAGGAAERRAELAAVLDEMGSPTLVIPGNRDGDVDRFYEDLPRPPETLDVEGVRFATFLDPEEPGFKARRTARDLARMKEARRGHDGPVVCIQHVPLMPPGFTGCPYVLTNADEVVRVSREAGVTLTVAGHCHEGTPLVRDGGATFVAAPALCVGAFPFYVFEIDPRTGEVSVERHELALPPGPELFDFHVHTEFAYCNDTMEMSRASALARDFGLAGLAFAEHSGQLLFERETYWSGRFLGDWKDHAGGPHDRTDEYLARADATARESGRDAVGLELDCDFEGRPVMRPRDRDELQLLLGSVHWLPELMGSAPDPAKAAAEFVRLTERLVRSGVGILAHPFRVFRRRGLEVPQGLFEPVVRALAASGVAAEMNFHGGNEPPAEFFRMCLEAGVKIAFGSDAHDLYEVGDFWPNLRLLEDLGARGRERDVLAGREDVLACRP